MRHLSKGGNIRFKKHRFFVSKALIYEYLGLDGIAGGVWSLYFCDRLMARFDERDFNSRS